MATSPFTRSVRAGETTYSQQNNVTATQEVVTQETIADSSTDTQVNHAIDISQLKGIYISTTADVTLETNDGSSPDDTIALKPGVPYQWQVNDASPLLLSADVTAFYVTNASGGAADVTIVTLIDATP